MYSIPCEDPVEQASRISKQLKINMEIIKSEISDHCDYEIKRFKDEMEKYMKEKK